MFERLKELQNNCYVNNSNYKVSVIEKILIFELFDINPEMKLPSVSMFKYYQKKFNKNADYIKYIELKNIVTGDFDKMCRLWYESRDKEIENLKEDIKICSTLIKNLIYKCSMRSS